MNQALYAKVKLSARFCRDWQVRRKIQLFLEVIRSGKVEATCRIFGFSSASFYYRWWNRFQQSGFDINALFPRSRRPKNSPQRISKRMVRQIRKYRFAFHYGPKRIAYYLLLNHQIKVSESTIRRTIERKGWILRRYRTKKKNPHQKRYELPYPGYLQVDIKYVPEKHESEQWYVYNAIDECSRWRFAKAYREINALNAIDFAHELVQVAPFKILRIQTDNDTAFTNRLSPFWGGLSVHPFDEALVRLGIEHRLIPPGMKELNGKVERSHKTDDEEFYWRVRCWGDFALFQQTLMRWIYAYNHHRPHSSLQGKTPIEALAERILVPLLVLALKCGLINGLGPKVKVETGRLATYLKYLNYLQADPFHSLDVLNYYTPNWGSGLIKVFEFSRLNKTDGAGDIGGDLANPLFKYFNQPSFMQGALHPAPPKFMIPMARRAAPHI